MHPNFGRDKFLLHQKHLAIESDSKSRELISIRSKSIIALNHVYNVQSADPSKSLGRRQTVSLGVLLDSAERR